MQASFELTQGQARLAAIVAEFPANSSYWNEAQNRFQFIDRLLLECLGWAHPFIEVEHVHGAGGKADYILGKPPRAVLEAKREAVRFDTLPTGQPMVVRKLQPLLRACRAFEEAVCQVITYCALRGARIALVCNGPQLAILQALTPGESPLEGECYLFNGFDAYLSSFPLLWKLLSPEGVWENFAYRLLSQHRNPRIPPKASSAIPDPYRYKYRSKFQENLRLLASLLLEDIVDHPGVRSDFYKECYVPIGANNRHLLLSKNIIAARYRRVSDTGVSAATLTSKNTYAKAGKFHIDNETLASSLGSRPIIVVGDVGVGKTSFFENLFEQLDAKEKIESYFIHINLGQKATLTQDIKAYILNAIPTILLSRYKIDIESIAFVSSIYHTELRHFDAGVYGKLREVDQAEYERERVRFLSQKLAQKDLHVQAALGHLAHGRNKQIILVIDNADQRNFETQQEAFLIAQELAASRNLLVFVALRPSTFFQSKLTGALSAYQSRVLTIAPPPADEVLMKRVSFALRVAEGKIAPDALYGIHLHLNSIVLFLRATLRSIRGNDTIRVFLSNITGGNTRLVIELMSGFCGSPNVNSEKVVRAEEQEGTYRVPLHEFTKHALLGEYAYYNPQSSLVACNIFDVSTADPREHFLASLIISYLISPVGLKDKDGFVGGEHIRREMASFNFLDSQVRYSLRRLAAARLIEAPHGHYREIAVEDTTPAEQFLFRATSIGVYHVRYWSGSFAFLDATSTDTPIFDDGLREVIFAKAASYAIADRLDKAETFRRYLEEQWHSANIHASYLDFVFVLKSQEESFMEVRKFVEHGWQDRKPRRRRS